MPIRQAFALLQFLVLALVCFGSAYYFSQHPAPKLVAPAQNLVLPYAAGAVATLK